MNYTTSLLTLCSIILLNGCGDSAKETPKEVITKEPVVVAQKMPIKEVPVKAIIKKDYTIDEIYEAMCITCHSSDGSGNTEKLTPSMSDLTEKEMYTALKEVEDDEGHVIMEHNRGQIIKMGMEYKAEDMSSYMFKRFNPEL